MFLSKEKDKLLPVVNSRTFNRITKQNNSLLPRVEDIFHHLEVAHFFSQLHLKSGLHHIHVQREDIEKTAFNIMYLQLEYMVSPMRALIGPDVVRDFSGSLWPKIVRGRGQGGVVSEAVCGGL